jgi:hypothetical protein
MPGPVAKSGRQEIPPCAAADDESAGEVPLPQYRFLSNFRESRLLVRESFVRLR